MTTADIITAVTLLKAGGLVAFPTETVYGLGADARNEAAVTRIFLAKQRPYDHPLIVHIADSAQLSEWARDIPASVWPLVKACWPGPLTLILKKQAHVLAKVTGNQDTVGLRIPQHPLALALLRAFGGGLAAPSANLFTHVSPTTAAAVKQELGDQIDLILDGGPCAVGVESTILDMSSAVPRILRPGMLNAATLSQLLGQTVISERQDTPQPQVPGMHHLHYAPQTKTILMSTQELTDFVPPLSAQAGPVAVMHYSDITFQNASMHAVKMPTQPQAYAQLLYQTLRLLDNQSVTHIVIEAVPAGLEWEAIRDRITKATAKR